MLRKIISLLTLAVVLLVGKPSLSCASIVRLLALGDMQGIVTDDSDYENNIADLASLNQRKVSSFYSYNYFSNIIAQNDSPSATIRDYERIGLAEEYGVNTVYPLNSSLIVEISYLQKKARLQISLYK